MGNMHRRAFIGAGATLAAVPVVSVIPTPVAARSVDPLLDLWRQYQENEASFAAIRLLDEDSPGFDAAMNRYVERWGDLKEEIFKTSATSVAGIRVKLALMCEEESGETRDTLRTILKDFDRLSSREGDP